MYVKPPRRQTPSGAFVPENYHGTAFIEPEEPSRELAETECAQDTEAVSVPASKPQDGGALGSLLSGLGGLRSDDILLFALIMLLLRSDDGSKGANEILPLLAILLFMG